MDPVGRDLSSPPPAALSTATGGGPPSATKGVVSSSSSRSVEASAGVSKTLVIAVESLKVEGDDVLDFKGRLPRSASMDVMDRQTRTPCFSLTDIKPDECDFEEDIIDGYSITSFKTLEDLEVDYFIIKWAS